jgi:hypothetical protein
MTKKPPKLDAATLDVMKRVLAMPPKHNEDLKVGRDKKNEEGEPKAPASSSKPRSA